MDQLEQERLATQDKCYQLDNELHEEQKKRFALDLEIEKFSRKGKQPSGKQAQRQQPNHYQKDEFESTKKAEIVIPKDDDQCDQDLNESCYDLT